MGLKLRCRCVEADVGMVSAPASWSCRAFVLVVLAGAAVMQQQPARAQAYDLRDGTMNSQPSVFDEKGGHHYCAYGYYGPPVPYFADKDLDNKSNPSFVGTCQIR
jgi:hypothetical protein